MAVLASTIARLRSVGAGGSGARMRNLGHLLSGSVAGALVGIPAIALSARALGTDGYGALALVVSYVAVIKRFADFQVWQPIIRYGAELDPVADRDRYRTLLKYGFAVDIGGSIAGWTVAVAGSFAVIKLFDIHDSAIVAMLIYASVLLFNVNGTPNAILRLSGRFRSIAYNQVAVGTVKVAMCAAAWASGAGLVAFALVWTIAEILGTLLVVGLALRELRRQDLQRLSAVRAREAPRLFPGIVRFTVTSNLSLTLWASAQQLDTLLVGYFVDPAAAGLYHFAKRIARLGQQLGQQVQTVVFPDLARLWASGKRDRFRRMIVQTEAIMACFGALLVLGAAIAGGPVIAVLAGEPFRAAGPLLTVQTLAVATMICGAVMRSALLAVGRADMVLHAVMASTAMFYLVAVTLLPVIGAMGANVAHVTLGLTWLALLARAGRKITRG